MANYVSKYTGAEIEAILEASSTKLNSNQTANYVLAGPASGSVNKPTFRKLVAADIPSLAASKITSGTFDAARIPSLNASKITAGTLSADRIPTLGVAKISGLATVATSGKYSDLSGVPGKATTTSDGLMSKEDKNAIADISRATDSEGNAYITGIPRLNITNTLSIKGTNISDLFAAKSVESSFYEFTEYAENTYAVKTVENLLLEDVGDDMILISQAGENPVWMYPGDIFDFAPRSHATASNTYGLATGSLYGHVKISNGDVNSVASANGLVAGMDHSHGNYALTTKLPTFSLSGTVLTITDNS